MPPERAAQVMAMLLGVAVSPGWVDKASARLAAQPGKAGFDEAMLAALAGEKALAADETPVNVLGNLLIERGSDDADPDHVYLTDFRIAKQAMSRTGLTSTGQFLGTVDYVAPEQIRGLPLTGQADQYSLGCVLYECLTGRVPFENDLDAAIIWAHAEETPTRPTVLRPELPPEVDDVFAGCWPSGPRSGTEAAVSSSTPRAPPLGSTRRSGSRAEPWAPLRPDRRPGFPRVSRSGRWSASRPSRLPPDRHPYGRPMAGP